MSGRVKRQVAAGPAGLVGLDVEARVSGGVVVRGRLLAAGVDWLEIEKGSGRSALVATRSVTCLVDERPPGLAAVGRRAAEDREAAEGD